MPRDLSPSLKSRREPLYKQDGPWSWVVLICAAFHALMSAGFNRSFGVFLPVLMIEFDESRGKVALVGSMATGTILLMSAFTGWLCTRVDVRVVSGIGHIIRCLSLLITPLLYNIIPMYFCYSLTFGVGGSFIFIPAMFSIMKYIKKRRSLAMGALSAGAGLGVMTIPPLSQYFIETVGWRNAYRLLACFFVGSCFCTLVYEPNVEENNEGEDGQSDSDEKVDEKPNKKRLKLLDSSLWKLPQLQIAVVSVCLASFGLYNAPNHLVKFAGEIGVPASKASVLYTFMGGVSVVARLITGRLCDIPCVKATYINQCCQALSAACIILLPQASTYTHLIAYSLTSGLLDGAFRTSTTILFAESGGSRERAAIAYSQATSVTAFFQAGGPAVAGVMADHSGNYASAFYMSGAVLLMAAAVQFIPLCLSVRRRSLKPQEKQEIELGDTNLALEEQNTQATYEHSKQAGQKTVEIGTYEVTSF